MVILPAGLDEVLGKEIYERKDSLVVKNALMKLDVGVSNTFRDFYERYAGPFWEEHVPFELLDIVEEENNIVSYTLISRKVHDFPKEFLVLSEMSANAVLVLDAITDKVYIINFEGKDELLLKGELMESWTTFYEFLEEYFHCK